MKGVRRDLRNNLLALSSMQIKVPEDLQFQHILKSYLSIHSYLIGMYAIICNTVLTTANNIEMMTEIEIVHQYLYVTRVTTCLINSEPGDKDSFSSNIFCDYYENYFDL